MRSLSITNKLSDVVYILAYQLTSGLDLDSINHAALEQCSAVQSVHADNSTSHRICFSPLSIHCTSRILYNLTSRISIDPKYHRKHVVGFLRQRWS